MTEVNAAERAYWNGGPGRIWADHDGWLTALHGPVTGLLVDRAGVGPGDRVLDVGCGTGFSTRAVAERTGPTGHVTGIDLSETLLALAREKGPERGVAYLHADAQTHDFEPESFDAIVSQFGVMFFSDPVAAFANLRRAARPRAPMTLACWGALDDNPWFLIPKTAGESEVEPLPPEPGAPSPTAFADRGRVAGLLERAGWAEVSGEAARLFLAPPGGLDEVVAMAFRVGPAARLIQRRTPDAATRRRIGDKIAFALAPYETGAGLRVPAAINVFRARAPG